MIENLTYYFILFFKFIHALYSMAYPSFRSYLLFNIHFWPILIQN